KNSLRELVYAAQAGDRSAFAELYTRYEGLVRSIALSRVPVDDVPDVVQEAFVRALGHLKTLRDASALGPWLAAIARNVARDLERERAIMLGSDEEPVRHGTQHDELQARVALRVIRALPKAYQQTIAMRLTEGMTGPEIAGRTGLSPASVRVNLHRGMKLLRERLEAQVRKKAG